MDREPAAEADGPRSGEPDRERPRARRRRLVPPAVTPLRASDLAAGAVGHLRGSGRARFRQAVEAYLDADGSATYTSFRRTLAACLRELDRQTDERRREVVVPAFCSSDFADAIEGVGLDVVRYDVDPETLAYDAESVGRAVGAETVAVVAVNVLGYSSPMRSLADTCESREFFLVEALGYALGTEYEGRRLGTFGDCAVLNFQQGKPIPVGGGMVVSQRPGLDFGDDGRPAVGANAGLLAGYAAFSRPRPYYAYTRLAALLERLGRDGRVSTHPESKLGVAYDGQFSTISDFQGAVGCRVLDRLDAHRAHRQQVAEHYRARLADCPGVSHLQPVSGLSRLQYVRYPILVRTEALRDRIQRALRDAGVQATTLYDWPVIDPAVSPGASELQDGILTLPTHPYVGDRARREVVETVRETTAAHAADR